MKWYIKIKYEQENQTHLINVDLILLLSLV